MKTKIIYGTLLGLATGDALEVSVEFKSRDHLRVNPIKETIDYS